MNMTNRDHIKGEVEKTLQSLDGLERATANPFLYTRIRAKMMRQENSRWEKIYSFISRPVIAIAILIAVIMINGWMMYNGSQKNGPVANTEINAGNDINNEYMASADNYETEILKNQ
jgi:hypothetical protein